MQKEIRLLAGGWLAILVLVIGVDQFEPTRRGLALLPRTAAIVGSFLLLAGLWLIVGLWGRSWRSIGAALLGIAATLLLGIGVLWGVPTLARVCGIGWWPSPDRAFRERYFAAPDAWRAAAEAALQDARRQQEDPTLPDSERRENDLYGWWVNLPAFKALGVQYAIVPKSRRLVSFCLFEYVHHNGTSYEKGLQFVRKEETIEAAKTDEFLARSLADQPPFADCGDGWSVRVIADQDACLRWR